MEQNVPEKNKSHPTPPIRLRPDRELDCAFEDIFATPPPIASHEIDSEYLHQKRSLFARFFHKKQAPKRAA